MMSYLDKAIMDMEKAKQDYVKSLLKIQKIARSQQIEASKKGDRETIEKLFNIIKKIDYRIEKIYTQEAK